MSLASHSTAKLEEEILRRNDAADAQRVLEVLRCSWEVAGVVAARAGLPRGQCVVGLFLLARDGKAQYRKAGSVTTWRRTKAFADRQGRA